MSYPRWTYFPRRDPAPAWVTDFVQVVAAHRSEIDSTEHRLGSDATLKRLVDDLRLLGYAIEETKAKADRIRRPVLFGEQGVERVAYEIDAFHDELGVVVELEAGRGRHGGALFRDLIRTSLIVGARYLAIGMLLEYRYTSGGRPISGNDYEWALAEIDAIYASGRLQLPFEGVLLFGY